MAGVGTPAGLLGLVDPAKSWVDRLGDAAYRSPSGTRITFDYEDVQREYDARGTAWEFPGLDEAYVQRKGFGARRYPMACIFSGRDHDQVATAFEAALLEPGIGELEHPRYGKISVVPFGTITRRDGLRSAANQTVIEVTFWTTLHSVYPSVQRSPRNEILASLGNFDVQAAQQFQASTSLVDEVSRANAKASVRGFLRDVSAALRSVSDATASVRREFDETFRLVNQGIDVFVGQPLLLAQRISDLIKAPARAATGIQSRLDGYARLAERIFGSPAGRFRPRVAAQRARLTNEFQIAHLMGMGATAGSVLALLEHRFATKPEAIGAADAVLAQFDALVAWRDHGFATLEQVDTGEAYQALQQAVALAAGFLIEVSFQLVPERRIVLDRPRTIIDLAAEIYGSVDERLDQLINSNHLTGSEILELPAGKVIVYYPQS